MELQQRKKLYLYKLYIYDKMNISKKFEYIKKEAFSLRVECLPLMPMALIVRHLF